MDPRTLRVLEFDKIRDRLAHFTSFSLGAERARALLPTDDIRLAQEWQAETGEARRLLEEKSDIYVGGVHDLRPQVEQALRGSVLLPADLIDVRYTLQRARSLQRAMSRLAEQFPHVADIALRIAVPQAVIDEIGRCIDERGELLDSASDALGRIRRELRTAHSRLLEQLRRLVNTPTNAQYLQEPIVTQRQGRYVIPLRAECKGRIPGLVHDQSGSGATLFIEPLAVVDLNNQWREAQLAEEEEIRRILAGLTEVVATHADAIRIIVEALGDLDLIFAKARYANELRAVEPELHDFGPRISDFGLKGKHRNASPPPTIHTPQSAIEHPRSVIRLLQARHPLLDPLTVVPVDIYLDDDYFIVLITGPNTGGKTVSLKTTGLLTLMAQAGLAIPTAEGAAVSVFEQVFADIGDEQSIEQSLSTFSSHMTHIVEILAQADDRSLVLLDELGAGTDPEEGAALAQALLNTLLDRRVTTLATTHYSELKVFAHSTPFVANASVEFDIETLSPTYKLTIGLPGQSNAFAIARRLGLASAIVTQAEALVSPQSLEAAAMLAEIKRAREAALSAEAETKAAQRRTEALNADLRYRLARIEEARREVLSGARAEADAELAAIRQEIAQVQERLAGVEIPAAGSPGAASSLHRAWLAEAEAVLARRAQQAQPLPSPATPVPVVIDGPLEVGDHVWVPSLQTTGEVVDVGTRDVEIKVGSFRLKLAPHRVELRERGAAPAVQASPSVPKPADPGMELDLRGMIVDDMLVELDRYLDTAYLAGLPWVRIIHGKGTGALRQAARDELRGHPLISEFRPGEANEGGEGVTVAKLVQR
ncbi:MAG: endonuclease MutS2 [Chloroflexi bacterium HGW-Chloroflexi-1]|nr:MAG: endonuclease MutS2 [Chloroflexi bacterium HGW-Chloroflexi-1]